MSITFTLEGEVEKYNALFTEDGYDQRLSTETYTLIAKSKEKGYRILGAAILVNTYSFTDGKWVYRSDIVGWGDVYSRGFYKKTMTLRESIQQTNYRWKIADLEFFSEIRTLTNKIESFLINKYDKTLENYRKLKPVITPTLPNTNDPVSIFFQDNTKIVYKIGSKFNSKKGKYFRNCALNLKYTYNDNGTVYNIPFVENSFFLQTEAQYQNQEGEIGFIETSPYVLEDNFRTENKSVTNFSGIMHIGHYKEFGATEPEPVYLTVPKNDVYILKPDNYIENVPKSISLFESSKTIYQNQNFALPATATLLYNDATTKTVNVTWNKAVDITTVGTTAYIASYTENGITVNTQLTLTVLKTLNRMYFDESKIDVFYNDYFVLPTKAFVEYSDNVISEVVVIWDRIIDASIKGEVLYTASYTEDGKTITANLIINVLLKPVSLTINKETIIINNETIFNPNNLIFTVKYNDESEVNKLYNEMTIDKEINLNLEKTTEYIFSYTENGFSVVDNLILKIDKSDPTFSILNFNSITINSSVLSAITNEPNCKFYLKISEVNESPTIAELKENNQSITTNKINKFESDFLFENLKSKKEYFVFLLVEDSSGNSQDSITSLNFKTLSVPFELDGGVFLGTQKIVIEKTDLFDEIHYRIENVELSKITNNIDSYTVFYSEEDIQTKLLNTDYILYNDFIQIDAPEELSTIITLAIQLYKGGEAVSDITLSEISIAAIKSNIESIFSDYEIITNKQLLRIFIDTDIEENKKYFYKVVSVKQKFVTK